MARQGSTAGAGRRDHSSHRGTGPYPWRQRSLAINRFALLIPVGVVLPAAGCSAATPTPIVLPTDKNSLFAASGIFAPCHTNLKDSAGTGASVDRAWGSSMQVNAGKDPYWIASVRSEILSTPVLEPG